MQPQRLIASPLLLAGAMLLSTAILSTAQAEEPPANPSPPADASAIDLDRDTYSELIRDYNTELVTDSYTGLVSDYNTIKFLSSTYANPVGVEVAPIEDALRAQLKLDSDGGVVVSSVAPDSEAAKAGLQPYDIVQKVGETAIDGPEKFQEVCQSEQGKEVKLAIVREGQPGELVLRLAAAPMYQIADLGLVRNVNVQGQYRLGVTLAEADDTLRSQLGLASGEGLVVTEVVPESAAAQSGIQQHDVLTKLDGKRLTTVEDINARLQEIKDREVTATFFRAGEETWLRVTPRFDQWSVALKQPRFTLSRSMTVNPWEVRVFSNGLVSGGEGGLYIRTLENLNTIQPPTAAAPKPSARKAMAALREQLAAMQKSLETLEASLAPPTIDPAATTEPAPAPASEPAADSKANSNSAPTADPQEPAPDKP